jgi:20S proteasome alpha/beta subunit
LQDVSNEYTVRESAKSPRMTYILGSRCRDGVVLVADRKFTVDQSGGFDPIYDNKLIGEFYGIIMGFSGARRRFELFTTYVMDYVKTTQGRNKLIPIEKFILKASEIARSLTRCDFDVLFGLSGNPSLVKHMYGDGGIESIREYVVIGTGEPVGRFFLKKYWNNDMSMEQIAELGYFVIKTIETYNVDETIGLSKKSGDRIFNRPQIWLIPDGKKDKLLAPDDPLLSTLENRVNRRMKKLNQDLFFG